MDLKNGYKVMYEVAANGERTIYATQNNYCDPENDTKINDYTDSDYVGKVIYGYEEGIFVSDGSLPAYDEEGVPTDDQLEEFNEVFIEDIEEESEEETDAPGEVDQEEEESEEPEEPEDAE